MIHHLDLDHAAIARTFGGCAGRHFRRRMAAAVSMLNGRAHDRMKTLFQTTALGRVTTPSRPDDETVGSTDDDDEGPMMTTATMMTMVMTMTMVMMMMKEETMVMIQSDPKRLLGARRVSQGKSSGQSLARRRSGQMSGCMPGRGRRDARALPSSRSRLRPVNVDGDENNL